MTKPKILFYDIETFPNMAQVWGYYEQNVLAITKTWELASFAYKWAGDKSVVCHTREGEKTDKRLAKKLWKLIDQADIVVAHNGDDFDNKKANAKFIEHGMEPPSPYLSIDTKKLARGKFKFNSNKLNELGKILGLGTKIQTGGFELWQGCMADNPKSWALMAKYNQQDVVLLEKIYLKLRGWGRHPNMSKRGHYTCPVCTSHNVKKRGLNGNLAQVKQIYQCRDCGKYSSEKISQAAYKKFLLA